MLQIFIGLILTSPSFFYAKNADDGSHTCEKNSVAAGKFMEGKRHLFYLEKILPRVEITAIQKQNALKINKVHTAFQIFIGRQKTRLKIIIETAAGTRHAFKLFEFFFS